MTTDDIRVAIWNDGSPKLPNNGDASFFWDGRKIDYKAPRANQKSPPVTIVPFHIAYEHWAITIDDQGRLVRATEKKPDERESQFERRLTGICPKVFIPQKDYEGNVMRDEQGRTMGNYDIHPEWADWFTNKIRFKAKRIPQSMTLEEFERA